PSPVQATADPVSRKRPLEPDQPGEGPSGIERGAQTVHELLPSRRAGRLRDDQARSLKPWQEALLKAVPRHTYETSGAYARRLVLEPALWPGPVLAKDLSVMAGIGLGVANCIRKLRDLSVLRELMREHQQEQRESDRDYARRLRDFGAPECSVCSVFQMTLEKLVLGTMRVNTSVLGGAQEVSLLPGKTVSGADEAVDRSSEPPERVSSGEKVSTSAGADAWPQRQPLQPWQQALLKLEPPPAPGSLESRNGHARRLALAAYEGIGVLFAKDLMLMAGIERDAASILRFLPKRAELSALMRADRQKSSETDREYAARLRAAGAPAMDLWRMFKGSMSKKSRELPAVPLPVSLPPVGRPDLPLVAAKGLVRPLRAILPRPIPEVNRFRWPPIAPSTVLRGPGPSSDVAP
ncbi:hypothetical protein SAMN05216359_1381, partial [Roseateles sp. YR242]|uniref:hypothetical protein n=1 Tax=Roseateles sp. YR242 TaxID=1855305 RepID=UPI0008CD21AB